MCSSLILAEASEYGQELAKMEVCGGVEHTEFRGEVRVSCHEEVLTNRTRFTLFHIALHRKFLLHNPELTAIFELSVSSTNY
jgi:hypothetical protein